MGWFAMASLGAMGLLLVVSIYGFIKMESRRRYFQKKVDETETHIRKLTDDIEAKRKELERFMDDQIKKGDK